MAREHQGILLKPYIASPHGRMNAIARHYQRVKNGIHALQAVIIFIGVAVTPAIFIEDGPGDGRISYYFGLVCNSVPPYL